MKSNPCDYNDAYILAAGDIVTTRHYILTKVAFKMGQHLLNVSQKLMEQQ